MPWYGSCHPSMPVPNSHRNLTKSQLMPNPISWLRNVGRSWGWPWTQRWPHQKPRGRYLWRTWSLATLSWSQWSLTEWLLQIDAEQLPPWNGQQGTNFHTADTVKHQKDAISCSGNWLPSWNNHICNGSMETHEEVVFLQPLLYSPNPLRAHNPTVMTCPGKGIQPPFVEYSM